MSPARPKTLNFITGNANKLAEVKAILSLEKEVELKSQALDLPELQGTIEEISRDKATRAAELVSLFLFSCGVGGRVRRASSARRDGEVGRGRKREMRCGESEGEVGEREGGGGEGKEMEWVC